MIASQQKTMDRLKQQLGAIESSFTITPEKQKQFISEFISEMEKGLNISRTNKYLQMLPSFVIQRPTGEETGKCISFDLGGTNFRICLYDLQGNTKYSIIKQNNYVITDLARTGNLFDWMAECAYDFCADVNAENIPCGYSFSFPFSQNKLNEGTLLSWTKGFSVPGIVGQNVVTLTQQALDKRNVNIKITAIVNDTVSLVITSGYLFPGSQVAAIVGTGNNGCYWESTKNIGKIKQHKAAADGDEMVINLEWGAFDHSRAILPYTMFDHKLQRESITFGFQVMEKMVSGLYLSELVRIVLLHLIDNLLIFDGMSSQVLNTPYMLDTKHISMIISDDLPDKLLTRSIVQDVFQIHSQNLKQADLDAVQRVCNIVCYRAKVLCGLALSAVLLKRPEIFQEKISVGLDGSLYGKMPGFPETVRKTLELTIGEQAKNIDLQYVEDGCLLGTAIIARMASSS